MPLRTFLTSSRAGRLLCVVLLAAFVLLCGLHLAGAHHDTHGDGLGLASEPLLLALVAVLLVLVVVAATRRAPSLSPYSIASLFAVGPSPRPTSFRLCLGSPLRC